MIMSNMSKLFSQEPELEPELLNSATQLIPNSLSLDATAEDYVTNYFYKDGSETAF